jgi:flagellar hook protein FlgE
VRDAEGGVDRYTRAGQLQFDKNGDLVTAVGGRHVMGFPAGGGTTLTRMGIGGLRTNPAHATTAVKFNGNLSNTSDEFTVDTVKLLDAVGAEHSVRLTFKNKNSTDPGVWEVTVFDGDTSIATGQIKFVNGMPDAAQSSMTFTFTPAGGTAMEVKLDFSADVTSFAAGNLSSLAVTSQDGYAAGAITAVEFDRDGNLSIAYSNGQTAKGGRIALARFESGLGLVQQGGSEFTADGTQAPTVGRPGDRGFGSIAGGQLEMSNVDLSAEFSDLIVMQRGYQASSRIVSTANEMLQELFDMKGHR